MYVLYNNDTYEINMSYILFTTLKRVSPSKKVKIKKQDKETETEIQYLEDYSVVRNLHALKS